MKNFWKQLGKAICYFLLYYGGQIVVSVGYLVLYSFKASFEASMNGGMLDVDAISIAAAESLLKQQNNIIIISSIFTILFLLIFFLIRKKNVLTEASVVKARGKNYFYGVGLGFGYMLVLNFGLQFLPESWLEAYGAHSNILLEGSDFAIFVSTVIMAPVIEELIFRGLMLSRLRKGMSDWVAILVSALIFGLAHGQILWMAYTFVMGVVFALVAVKSESVLPSMVMHMVFNFCGMTLPFILSESISVGMCVALTVIGAIIMAVFLVLLLKQSKVEKDTVQAA